MRTAIAIVAALVLAGCDGAPKDAVRSLVRDPDSTQFRYVQRCSHDRTVWRGDYNAKNGFGAYTGFQPFYYSEIDRAVATLEHGNFEALSNRCFGKYADQP
ncbi:MAG TPA: hypothetical protein PKD99_14100 [Sphingopyxis sp.]|nr:hypothetical protein [Sphingopyxis sp.]HMP46229.1 hypothetical protein [Sphingopyxis sp.]HMQ18591.1 hypothetical protein [Sphingopyxis sp.]